MKRSWLLLAGAVALACDPIYEDAITALGGEAPGVPRGPLHRPGQPCVLCHDGSIGNPPGFSVAGTVYVNPGVDLTPAVGAEVMLLDSQGHSFNATTNKAGNFYVLPHEFQPVYPMKVSVMYGTVTVKMTADVGRDGSCAKCHFDPASSSTPGHVYVPPDGVAP
jgi:hypothetical protein